MAFDDPRLVALYDGDNPDGDDHAFYRGLAENIDARRILDLAVLTGNVAQHIEDTDWSRTLSDLHGALRKGGTLAFESRNPAGRAWDSWCRESATERDTPHGRLRERVEATEHPRGRIEMRFHNVFIETGDHVIADVTLVFRDHRTEIFMSFADRGLWLKSLRALPSSSAVITNL